MICPKCKGVLILKDEEMKSTLCFRCREAGKKHAQEFIDKYKIPKEKENE